MFQAGEIVIAAFPFTSLAGVKRRPCAVLARGDAPNDFILAFISSTVASARLPSAVLVEPHHASWRLTGLKAPSVIRADKVVTLNDCVISGAIGVLPEDVLAAIRLKLKNLLQTP
jgi:mRNA-degrading endonuclease toxin of MazEF toxin-antitoxin module